MKIFFFVIIIIILNKSVYSYNLFDTSFYEINFESTDIENQKINLINQLKIKSLSSILVKTLIYDDYNKIKKDLSDDLINTFIKNIIINDEIIVNNKYFSNIKINFNKRKIIEYYRLKKLPYIEYFPDKILLIIYEENSISNNLFSKNNNHYSYFNKNLQNHYLFKVPNLDINDRFILTKEDLLNKNLEKIDQFANKYNLSEIIIIFATEFNNKIDYNLLMYSQAEILEKKLTLSEINYEKFFKLLDKETLFLWKKINKIQNNSLKSINCNISYYNIFELKEIKKNLNNISIINNLKINSLSYQNIEYNISFYGDGKILSNLLEFNKLKINSLNNDCKIGLK